MREGVREEFEKAWSDYYENEKHKFDYDDTWSLMNLAKYFGARWMAERCAKLSETSTITIPNESGGSVTMSKDGGDIAVEIRQMEKELE